MDPTFECSNGEIKCEKVGWWSVISGCGNENRNIVAGWKLPCSIRNTYLNVIQSLTMKSMKSNSLSCYLERCSIDTIRRNHRSAPAKRPPHRSCSCCRRCGKQSPAAGSTCPWWSSACDFPKKGRFMDLTNIVDIGLIYNFSLFIDEKKKIYM